MDARHPNCMCPEEQATASVLSLVSNMMSTHRVIGALTGTCPVNMLLALDVIRLSYVQAAFAPSEREEISRRSLEKAVEIIVAFDATEESRQARSEGKLC